MDNSQNPLKRTQKTFRQKYIERPSKLVVALIFIASVSSFFFVDTDSFRRESNTLGPSTLEAIVTEITSERAPDETDTTFITTSKIQELKAEMSLSTSTKSIATINIYNPLKSGDKIFVRPASLDPDESIYEIVAIGRNRGLLALSAFFILLVVFTSGAKGMNAFVGLALSFSVIFTFIVPQILTGSNPVLVSLLGSMIILVGALYTSYGFNRKSLSALIGISITLTFVGILAYFLVYRLSFTGNTNEEATFLVSSAKHEINLVGLLVAGIIISAIGVLDDIAITQASIVSEFKATNPSLTKKELFQKAMKLGRDHISAVVNTLVLAYTGASLPLVLLFVLGGSSVPALLSSEAIAEEIVRTLAATCGLVLAVPITTLIAIAFFDKGAPPLDEYASEQGHIGHNHG